MTLASAAVRARSIVPDEHPLSAALGGKKGIDALGPLMELALKALRAREHPQSSAEAIAGVRGVAAPTEGAVNGTRVNRPIPKQLVNFRPRRKN